MQNLMKKGLKLSFQPLNHQIDDQAKIISSFVHTRVLCLSSHLFIWLVIKVTQDRFKRANALNGTVPGFLMNLTIVHVVDRLKDSFGLLQC
jgi:hypothetical protein